MVHGCSLLRCSPKQLRPEFPEEAKQWEEAEPTLVLRALRFRGWPRTLAVTTRGPVNFRDLTGEKDPPADELGSDDEKGNDRPKTSCTSPGVQIAPAEPPEAAVGAAGADQAVDGGAAPVDPTVGTASAGDAPVEACGVCGAPEDMRDASPKRSVGPK